MSKQTIRPVTCAYSPIICLLALSPPWAAKPPEPYRGVCACGHAYQQHAAGGRYCLQSRCRCLHYRRPASQIGNAVSDFPPTNRRRLYPEPTIDKEDQP